MPTPKLRFALFSEEWKLFSLDELLKFKNGINAAKEDYGFGYKFINVLDIIQNDFITHDTIIGEVNISQKEFENNKVEYGDILFQRSSETREEVGQANVYLDKEIPATFGGFVIRGKMNSQYVPAYMNYLLKTSSARKDITSKSGGSTRYNVSQSTLSEVKLYISSLPEQQKIADFLSTVDQKIQTLTKKKELLELYKKGVMQKIFKQEIRFKQDDGSDFPEWEEKRLGDILTIGSGKDYKHLSIGEIPVYGTGGLMLHVNEYLYDGESVGIGRKGTINKPIFLSGRFWTVDTLFFTHTFNEVLPFFVYSLFQRINWLKYNEASGVPSLSKATIEKINICIPVVKEQTKIANFLTALDDKINVVSSQIEKMKKWKKGLLQQMFV